jgi:hypothetical protein
MIGRVKKGIKVVFLTLAAVQFASCASPQRISGARAPEPSLQVQQAKAKERNNDKTGLMCVLLFGFIMFNKVAE